jgi:cytochrome c-type biogenesis protein CcmH
VTSARRLLWILVGATALVTLAVALWPQADDSVAARRRRLASELRCSDCEGLSVLESHTASAADTRRDIAVRIRRGESDAAIRQAYVDSFGEQILLKPRNDGVGLIVWALPIVVLVAGAAVLVLALRRWRAQPRLAASADDEEYVAAHRGGGDG